MNDETRQSATLREAAKIMRSDDCPAKVLSALRCCSLTAPELFRVLRGKYAARTIYGALETLRHVGLVASTGHKAACCGSGPAEIWGVL